MASKKKQRRTEQRQQKSSGVASAASTPTSGDNVTESPRPPLAGMDRFLTLVGFGVLIVLVVLIAPYFAHKQDRDFEKSAAHLLAALAGGETSGDKLTPEVIKQLQGVGAYPAQTLGAPFLQGGAKQASLRTAFEGTEGKGLLSVGFLLKQELSLDSRWYPVSFCRPDRQGAQVARDFLLALVQGEDAKAYALSGAAVEELNRDVSLESFTAQAQNWRQAHASEIKALEVPMPLPDLSTQAEQLKATWPKTKLSFFILENPLTCAYAVQFTLQ